MTKRVSPASQFTQNLMRIISHPEPRGAVRRLITRLVKALILGVMEAARARLPPSPRLPPH